ncbi:NAD(P)/FAD-dependent oxidoreductase [Alicyclobacillus cycloheptanicus]|uniref:NADH dehydrogenase n=1 Tax=Alicyclobacillus cycloheptanicus TaxID=1457 RepID=A0ABT9XJL8_9BACL|nr:NAD(P)/FAD-dependent oxidoreductase [Alicyclobacillus cycloheptanicus]MDQ0190497.1 NADH dehydrogenase [Alicyclobacillus cycloheptanicus]WDM00741.1 NAD(P)/FAD-dependent oxidoreductase [Alicyclobacillus cycloheptanicus]
MSNRILIIGAGYAGMLAATRLERVSEPFTMVNKDPYHYFTTLLHEAAGGRGEPTHYTVQIKDVLRKPTSEVIVDEVTKIDRERRVVVGKSGEYSFDYLIITLGWVPEYFGIEGLKENSLVLRNVDTAAHIRNHIEQQFQAYLSDGDETHLRIVVGGGGLTGIELLGELLDWVPKLCVKYGVNPSLVDLQNVEAMPNILPQVSATLREVAVQTLTERGATLRTNTKIVKAEPGVLHVDGAEPIRAGTIIWTGGVRANPLLAEAGFTVDRRGKAKVNAYLQSVDDERIFIGGDSAWCEDAEGKPVPPTAQAAMQMGKVIGDNVSSHIHGQPMRMLTLKNKGTLASLGPEVGVGDAFGIPVKGVAAGLAKEATKVEYLWELGGLRLVADKTGEVVHI